MLLINFYMHKCHDDLTTSDWILMFYGSLDSSHWGASNRLSLGLMDEKLFAFYSLKIFANSFSFIDNKDMGILRLDVPQWDKSNEI